jgi:hypothetical protein
MRRLTKILLALNGVSLLFIVLWLLVGGGSRGYFRGGGGGGGAATEVDGILLMVLGLFNLAFLLAVLLVLPGPNAARVQAAVQEALNQEGGQGEERFHAALRSWSVWALAINGVLVLFVGLWLLINSGRWDYFQANATEVDMILLFLLSILNIAYMGLAFLRFSSSAQKAHREQVAG